MFEKWITVFAAFLLVAGAVATWSARTWGAGLTLLAASAFPVAHLLGMAPSWFWGVGAVGSAPFLLTWKPMARFDRGATILFATLALAGGIACAFAWHEVGGYVIANFYPR